jgi:O-antigen/teichoic acid export membrane protein
LNIRGSLQLVFGQTVWAVAQALLLLYLAQVSGLVLVGVVTVGFAVFAPVALLLSFNLRTSVAINLLPKLEFRLLLLFRLATSFVSVLIAATAAWAVDSGSSNAVCAALLLSTKLIDNVADLNVGLYQRDHRMGHIANSLNVRGIAILVAIGISIVAGLDALTFCALAAGLYAATFVLFDMSRIDLRGGNESDGPKASIRQTIGAIQKNWMSALFPAADNLHQNCLRLGATLFFEISTVGLIGLALTAYAPMQLLVTAVGMKILPQLRQHQQEGDKEAFEKVRRMGMLYGLGIASATVVIAFFVPALLYEMVFKADGDLAKRVTVMVGLANWLLPMCGLMSLSLIASQNTKRYLFGPILAVGVFWILVGILAQLTTLALLHLCAAAFFASALRVLMSLGGQRGLLRRMISNCLV